MRRFRIRNKKTGTVLYQTVPVFFKPPHASPDSLPVDNRAKLP